MLRGIVGTTASLIVSLVLVLMGLQGTEEGVGGAAPKKTPTLVVEYPEVTRADVTREKVPALLGESTFLEEQRKSTEQLEKLAEQIRTTSQLIEQLKKDAETESEKSAEGLKSLHQKIISLEQSAGNQDSPAEAAVTGGLTSFKPQDEQQENTAEEKTEGLESFVTPPSDAPDHECNCDCDCPTLPQMEEMFRRVLSEYRQGGTGAVSAGSTLHSGVVPVDNPVITTYLPSGASPTGVYSQVVCDTSGCRTETVRAVSGVVARTPAMPLAAGVGFARAPDYITMTAQGETKIVMYTLKNFRCSACDYVKRNKVPKWRQKGYKVSVVEVSRSELDSPNGKIPYFDLCEDGGCRRLTYQEMLNSGF